jgi:hypothetical protein
VVIMRLKLCVFFLARTGSFYSMNREGGMGGGAGGIIGYGSEWGVMLGCMFI